MIETTSYVESPVPRGGVSPANSAPARLLSVVVAMGALSVAAFAALRSPQPAIALLILGVTIIAAAIRPINGLYAIVFLTLAGDAVTAPWYPFTKNLSSGESLLYLANRLTLSPLEIVIAATFTFWIINVVFTPRARVITGPLFAPISLFTGFVAFGFVHGVGTGGDLRIALFEGRAIFALLPVYILILNLCDRSELRRLMWTAVAGVFVNALFAIVYLNQLAPLERAAREDLGEHSASVQFGFVFLLTLTLFLYRGGSRLSRLVMLALSILVMFVFLEAQRRSAVVAVGVGLILIIASLWWNHRTKLLVIAPLLLVSMVGYSAAFWNSTSGAGFPAQAIKAVVAPDATSDKDQDSNLYRDIENFNLNYTIRSAPVLGIGFGQRFLRPAPLPDISFFEFYEYIPHNSILWIWIKTGFFGFLSLLTVFAVAVREGARQVVSARDPMVASMAMIGVVNVAMFGLYAFVDIAWDPRSIVFLAFSLALCTVAWIRPDPGRRLP